MCAEAPDQFVCPLTLEVMKVPYRDAATGRSYERAAILEWIWFGSATCPLTRQPLKPSNFSVNHSLTLQIWEWKKETGLLAQEAEEEEEANDDSEVLLREYDEDSEEPNLKYNREDLERRTEEILSQQRAKFQAHWEQRNANKQSTTRPVPEVESFLQAYV